MLTFGLRSQYGKDSTEPGYYTGLYVFESHSFLDDYRNSELSKSIPVAWVAQSYSSWMDAS
jgi:hypothetical protein